MAIRSTTPARKALMGLAVAGALAGTAGPAAAQYYLDEGDVIYRDYSYGDYGYRGFGYRYRPMPASPIALSLREISRIALRDFGLAQVERTVRSGESYVVDGQAANGRRSRLILDVYSGDLIRRVALPPSRRPTPEPDIARVDPRDGERPVQPRLAPRPPERPAALKPPAQASAPATVVPPSPAAPPAPEPQAPAEQPPASASAPATSLPPAPAQPAAPTEPATPQPDKPRLVNPQDVRGTEEPDRLPPLARALSGTSASTSDLPPAQSHDAAPSQPQPATPIPPYAPVE